MSEKPDQTSARVIFPVPLYQETRAAAAARGLSFSAHVRSLCADFIANQPRSTPARDEK